MDIKVERIRRKPLNIPTYIGGKYGECDEPNVLYLPSGWNGYKYWMVFLTEYQTPKYETVSIAVSNDRIGWTIPKGGNNPIVPIPPEGNNCDPCIVLVKDKLVIYWLWDSPRSNRHQHLRRRSSKNGILWSKTIEVLSSPEEYQIWSPAVLHENKKYYLFHVNSGEDGCSPGQTSIRMQVSSDGLNFEPPQKIKMEIPGYVIWHFNIFKRASGDYLMPIAAYPESSDCGHCLLFCGQSKDKLIWKINPTPILSPSETGWDNRCIYRSSLITEDNKVKLWYSAISKGTQEHKREYRIGYAEGVLEAVSKIK